MGANFTGRLKIAGTIHSLDGATVRSWAPGNGCVLAVYDVGVTPPAFGSIGAPAPTKTLKEWYITANTSKSYNGDSTLRTDSYANQLVQGEWANGRGNQRAWFTFSNTDVATKLDDLIGVAESDVVTAELMLAPTQWGSTSNTGTIAIGYHNTVNSLPNTEPGGGIPNVHRIATGGFGTLWFTLRPPSAPSNFLDSMRDGYLNGFMIGNTFSGFPYCVVCEGVGYSFSPPQLHMKYWK